jgi:hypothetical protein
MYILPSLIYKNMKDYNLIELYKIKARIIREGIDNELLDEVIEAINYKENLIIEDISATGGPN